MKTMTLTQIKRFRFHHNRHLPSWYRWWIHVGLNVVILVSSVLVTILKLDSFHPKDALFLGSFFFVWALIEYLIHRFILHGELLSQLRFKKQHSFFHHGYFSHQTLEATHGIDINRILLFPVDIIAVTLMNAGISTIIGLVLNSHIGMLFFIAGMSYLIVYEIGHWICHANTQWSHPWIKSVVEHHRLHHAPALMDTKNFAVILPFVDIFFKTKVNSRGKS